MTVDLDRLGAPLFEIPTGAVPTKARQLIIEPCAVDHARLLTERWHSRLPHTQRGPWMYAFRAAFDGVSYGVALLHNPSARTLPSHWIELRRLTVAPDAPPHTASRMLGQLRRWFQRNVPEAERLISYQDPSVHKGTIYKAAGWAIGYVAADRTRDRTGLRPTGRAYRWNHNGDEVDQVGKIRWEIEI